MRRFASVTAAALLVLGLAVGAAAAPSDEFATLLHDHDEAQLRLYPSLAVQRSDKRYLGRYEETLTATHLTEERRVIATERARLRAIARGALSPRDQMSYDILAWTLALRAEELAPGAGERRQQLPIDQFGGAHLTFAREMEWRAHHPFVAAVDYDRAISRLHGFARWMANAIARMREGAAKGNVLPRVIVERIIPQVEDFARDTLETTPFMGAIRSMPKSIKPPDRARIVPAFAAVVRNEVLPAYRNLLAFLKNEYLPKARTTVGLSALPWGRRLYLHEVRERTTLDLSPDAIHALGLREIKRIEGEMERVKDEAGFSGTLDEFRAYLRTDPRFKFRNANAILAAVERARRTANARVLTQFTHLPKSRLDVRLFEDFLAPTKSSAEYSPISADMRRPGTMYVNAYDLPSRPNFTTEAMTLHEGIPGHHLQGAIAAENAALPYFRRFGGSTAFVEGWALYAEKLGPALGLYRDPYQKFGALAYDAWRSARLVVDTGIHWKGWSEREASDFMRAHTVLSDTEIRAEVERYIAIPAQALAYKIGELKFLELREKARTALGAKFDIRRFHDALIADGAMPLPILEARMGRWIAAEKIR